MPDTPRSREELQNLFSDNNAGLISAQDVRDWLASQYLKPEVDALLGTKASSVAIQQTVQAGTTTIATLTNLADVTSIQIAVVGRNGVNYLAIEANYVIASGVIDPGIISMTESGLQGELELMTAEAAVQIRLTTNSACSVAGEVRYQTT